MSSISRNKMKNTGDDNTPMTKSEVLNQSMQELNQMKRQYQEMLSMGLENDNDDFKGPDSLNQSGLNLKSACDVEIQQWNKTWTKIVSMMTQHVILPTVRANSGAEKRAILVDLVTRVCDKLTHPEESVQYQVLQEKYTKAKKSLRRLHIQCDNLLATVQQNAIDLQRHMKQVDGKERDQISREIEKLNDALSIQLRQEGQLIKESRGHKDTLKAAVSKMKKGRYNEYSDEYDEHPKHNSKKSKHASPEPERRKQPNKYKYMLSDSDYDDHQDSDDEPRSKHKKETKKAKHRKDISDSDSDEAMRIAKKWHSKKDVRISDSDSESESDSDHRTKKAIAKYGKRSKVESDSDSDRNLPKRKKGKNSQRVANSSSDDDEGRKSKQKKRMQASDSDSSDRDIEAILAAAKRHRRANQSSESDDEDNGKRRRSPKRQRRRDPSSSSSDEDDGRRGSRLFGGSKRRPFVDSDYD